MKGALFIDPYDIEGFSERIKESLQMPSSFKQARMRDMRDHLKINNVYKWMGEQLTESAQIVPSSPA